VNAEQLAREVEAHLSPQFRAELLQADLALANALRELVEFERAKQALSAFEAMEGKLKTRTTLYPDKIARPGIDPSFIGALRLAQRNLSLRAWIGPDNKFINFELTIC
jgi:hypothetical protein